MHFRLWNAYIMYALCMWESLILQLLWRIINQFHQQTSHIFVWRCQNLLFVYKGDNSNKYTLLAYYFAGLTSGMLSNQWFALFSVFDGKDKEAVEGSRL